MSAIIFLCNWLTELLNKGENGCNSQRKRFCLCDILESAWVTDKYCLMKIKLSYRSGFWFISFKKLRMNSSSHVYYRAYSYSTLGFFLKDTNKIMLFMPADSSACGLWTHWSVISSKEWWENKWERSCNEVFWNLRFACNFLVSRRIFSICCS